MPPKIFSNNFVFLSSTFAKIDLKKTDFSGNQGKGLQNGVNMAPNLKISAFYW